MMRSMAEPEDRKIDRAALRAAADLASSAADEISRVSRRLRLPVPAPATDPVSLDLAAQASRVRRQLGLTGAAAADELSSMLEFLLSGAYHIADLATRAQIAMLGLDVAPIANPDLTRAIRHDVGAAQQDQRQRITRPAELFSFAVLLGEGHPDWSPQAVDTAAVRAVSTSVFQAGEMIQAAVSYGARPGATFARFGAWICHYADAVAALEAAVGEWAATYRALRKPAQVAGEPYVRFLAATVGGNPAVEPDPAPAAAILERYLAVRIPSAEIADFPRLVS